MTELEARQLIPGQRVVHSNHMLNPEYGVIVCTWDDNGTTDCYVAFLGSNWPEDDKQPKKPYVLRYYGTSLDLADE